MNTIYIVLKNIVSSGPASLGASVLCLSCVSSGSLSLFDSNLKPKEFGIVVSGLNAYFDLWAHASVCGLPDRDR